MTNVEIQIAVKAAVKNGNWIIRGDNEGVSASDDANGFKWNSVGEWTEAPDWNEKPECGGGLHGQDKDFGGVICGTRLVFCDTEGAHIPIEDNKVKVRKARILLINELPALPNCTSLNVRGTPITKIPALPSCMWLDVRGTRITKIPALPSCAWLNVSGTPITKLPALPKGATVYK